MRAAGQGDDSYADVGPQDLVVLAMKAHQVEAVAADVPKLFGPKTIVIPMQNGIPYWYFHGHRGAWAGTRVKSVDPSGAIYDNIPCERVAQVARCFVDAGLQAPILSDIRSEIWLKLWGYLTFNPISALSRATLAGICQYPPSRALAAAMMSEAQSVANQRSPSFWAKLWTRGNCSAGTK